MGHVAPAPEGELIYCCTKPHREEQKPAVAEQQVQVQTESKADGICEGADCCDGRGSSWFDNKAGCLAQQTEGKCGGCEPFHPNKGNPETLYCCHKHWNEEKEQKPAVAEQQVEVQTDSKADAVCEGEKCCDGRGTQWIDNLAGCKAMEVEGKCGEGGCWPFHVAPAPEGELIYCCTKPHREEQKPAVAEQQVQVQTESKADAVCEGEKCCDGRGSSWFDNKAGCLAQQTEGKCGGCEPFHPNKGNPETLYCCHKHWNEEKEQKPAVAEQQVEVQTDSKADGMCVGPDCCD